jgi:hypothetical protein
VEVSRVAPILPQSTTIRRHSTNAAAPVTGNAALLAFRFGDRGGNARRTAEDDDTDNGRGDDAGLRLSGAEDGTDDDAVDARPLMESDSESLVSSSAGDGFLVFLLFLPTDDNSFPRNDDARLHRFWLPRHAADAAASSLSSATAAPPPKHVMNLILSLTRTEGFFNRLISGA